MISKACTAALISERKYRGDRSSQFVFGAGAPRHQVAVAAGRKPTGCSAKGAQMRRQLQQRRSESACCRLASAPSTCEQSRRYGELRSDSAGLTPSSNHHRSTH